MAPSALSHGDGAPGAGAEDCISSPALARRVWRVVGWVDMMMMSFICSCRNKKYLLDVIGGVDSHAVMREGCPRTNTGVSQRWFSGHFRQVFINAGARLLCTLAGVCVIVYV